MGEATAAPAPDQGTLLVVDDEPFLYDAVATSLRFLGFEVTAAETVAGKITSSGPVADHSSGAIRDKST